MQNHISCIVIIYMHIGLHIVSGGGANGKLLWYGIGGGRIDVQTQV